MLHWSHCTIPCLVILAGATAPLKGQMVREIRDAPYVSGAGEEQHLDLSLPAGRDFPTLIFVHGGSLVEAGERRGSPIYRNVCRPFVAAGVACATVDYRLAPGFQWPAMPEDVAAAVRWVRDRVAAAGGDSRRLVLFGHSSGCLLVAALATDSTYLAGVGISPRELAGVVPMGCMLNPVDTAGLGITPDSLRHLFAKDADDIRVYGDVDRLMAANPSRYLGPQVPPVLVVLAEAERFHPPILEQGARFVRLLLELDRPANLLIVPGKHFSSIEGVARGNADPAFAAILRFIRNPPAVRAP